MKYLGKIVGAVLGWWIARHPLGIAIGLALGHAWDEGLLRDLVREMLPQPAVKPALQDPLFALAGAVTKADGRVSQAEIAAAEALMRRMNLDAAQRKRAIARFQAGKAADFDLHRAGRELRAFCGFDGQLKLVMLEALADVGCADGRLSREAEQVLERIARALDTTRPDFEALIARKRGSPVQEPYAVLGLQPGASDEDVRLAYRRIMSECHPDRLAGQDLSPQARAEAEERARAANSAYDRIKSARGFK